MSPDRLKAARGRKCMSGPSRHGPGNNHFLYFHDEDGAMIECCSELAQMKRDGYQPKTWSMHPARSTSGAARHRSSSSAPASRIATPQPGRPAWAMEPDRTPATTAA